MSPPIDSKDEERIARIVRRIVQEETKPIERDLRKHSGKFGAIREEVSPAVAAKISDSQHTIEDRAMGFERLVLDAIASTRADVAAIAKSIPPAAQAAKGAEAAAVAGAHAAIAAKGVVVSTAVSANSADLSATSANARSLAAKRWAFWGTIAATAGTIAQLIQYLITHFG